MTRQKERKKIKEEMLRYTIRNKNAKISKNERLKNDR
jgi:hypothetical protein